MWPGRFFWKLFLGIALLMAAVLISSIRLISGELQTVYLRELSRQLIAQAETISREVKGQFDAAHAASLNGIAHRVAALTPELRVTFISINGTVWGDSEADPSHMEPHANRAEFMDAIRTGQGESSRWSRTTSRETKYVAVRVGDAAEPLGVVRVSMPTRFVAAHEDATRRLVWKIGGVGIAAALVLALGLALVWSAPIRRITETARTLSRGDLSARVRVTGRDELGVMAQSLNQMRDHLASQLQTIDRQRQNLEYLIRTLQEGVIVAGADGRILLINPAAVRLIRLMQHRVNPQPLAASGANGSAQPIAGNGLIGQSIEECVPHQALQDMLRTRRAAQTTASSADPGSGDLTRTRTGREVRLEFEHAGGVEVWSARASHIELAAPRIGDSEPAARLVVLTDITELTRTIQMKTDFVANASHELRTPLSAIRAAVETLQQLDPAAEPGAVRNFVEVIDRHSTRLVDLVADLLDLSKLESAEAQFPPQQISLREFLDELRSRYAAPINVNGLSLDTSCADNADELFVSPQLLRLVLDNLVDNAIKFTERGGEIRVAAVRANIGVGIEVSDTGCGIPEDQQPRVFERFYQVQRARSGLGGGTTKVRGTGLGLSIVRHAVAAMQGRVDLWSRVGEGTRVTVTIPRHS